MSKPGAGARKVRAAREWRVWMRHGRGFAAAQGAAACARLGRRGARSSHELAKVEICVITITAAKHVSTMRRASSVGWRRAALPKAGSSEYTPQLQTRPTPATAVEVTLEEMSHLFSLAFSSSARYSAPSRSMMRAACAGASRTSRSVAVSKLKTTCAMVRLRRAAVGELME